MTLQFGLHIGTRGAAVDPASIKTLVQTCDRVGFSHVGFSDHIVITRSISSRYPYNESGTWPGVGSGFCLEQLSCITYAAACSERVRLLSSVMVVPHRPAVLTAKTLATIDVLSRGRLTVGVGVGWMQEEMAALGSPPYDKRGAASNEYIEAFRVLWSEESPRYKGKFVTFDDVLFEPKPVQRPGPPIWVGGEGAAARRRAARLGDGWYPTIRNPAEPLDEPARFAAALVEVRRLRAEAGRDPDALQVAIFAPGLSVGTALKAAHGGRMTFTGSPAEIAADARAFAAAGVQHIIVGFESHDLADAVSRVERFAAEIVPQSR